VLQDELVYEVRWYAERGAGDWVCGGEGQGGGLGCVGEGGRFLEVLEV
jgi:hypothetical protein